MNFPELCSTLGIQPDAYLGDDLAVTSPIDGSILASISLHTSSDINHTIQQSVTAFQHWRAVPAPKRGELVRIYGDLLRQHKETLGHLVTLECGKILQEGLGEVQEMIDICDFAVGLSRQLYGLTIASERYEHTMQENWYPIGPVGIISAFNFPVAVWAWNTALALVCGDSVLWKPSEKTPLCAIACHMLLEQACTKLDYVPEHLSSLILGHVSAGEQLVNDRRVPLISATGSCAMGRIVGPVVAERFGKSILELGGNNAVIVTQNADLELALPSIVFGAVGTAGQRCTTTRRLFVHEHLYDTCFDQLHQAYQTISTASIGNPLDDQTLVGPLIDQQSFDAMQTSLQKAATIGEVYYGERVLCDTYPNAYYVSPALVKLPDQAEIVLTETFAPILYVMPYASLEDVMMLHNAVPQGLSSAIFTTDIREAEYFKQHSDCGIANVNIGTSGAEIGGAFGGEKETGGGRESGSDAWKAYMRRQTSTTYYGTGKPDLAQGISFKVQ